jgi:hypothetical protein
LDSQNYIVGWCAITTLGKFDYRKGGHLILWKLKLVIQFPPAWTFLIPSAYLKHGNTDIGPNETRYSFTQYTAGGLFRFVEDGFKLRSCMTQSELEDVEKRQREISRQNLNMYSTLEELKEMYAGS